MVTRTSYKNGLTIPEHIRKTLSAPLLMCLEEDAHGISFNTAISIQMRYVFKGEQKGGSYTLGSYNGSWEEALKKAVRDHDELKIKYPNSARYLSPERGVRFSSRVNSRKHSTVHSFDVNFKDEGKYKNKAFYCGTDNTITAKRKKHAQYTAWHFRRLYCEKGDPTVFSKESCKDWESTIYYDETILKPFIESLPVE